MRSARILVVDDEPRYGKQLAEILRRDGYEVETAEDIAGALTTAQQFRPNVLLVDWMLKDQDTGLDLACRLRELDSGMSTIMMTGFVSEAFQSEARSQAVAAFLEKPFELTALREAIVRAVDLSNAADR